MLETGRSGSMMCGPMLSPTTYKRGDAVWLHDPTKQVGRSPKLKLPWVGPFIVIERLADFVYRIQRRAGPSSQSKPSQL